MREIKNFIFSYSSTFKNKIYYKPSFAFEPRNSCFVKLLEPGLYTVDLLLIGLGQCVPKCGT